VTKQSGLGQNFYLDGVDLSGDTGSASRISGGLATVLPVPGINREAMERIGGGRDGGITWQSWFNPAAGKAHPTLATLPTGDRLATWVHRPLFGVAAACVVAKQINYDGQREANANFPFTIETQGNAFGLEWTEQLTDGPDTFTGAASGSGLDYGAGIGTTNFGLQAYLQVFAPFTGTSATVTIQHSNDNGAGDAYANIAGAGFTAVSAAPGSQRIQTARNTAIKRWLRIDVTGIFTDLTIAVFVVKNLVNTVF
jgi:hypothetical protein